MFGLGTTELIIIIGALFLLFIAPSRLPKLASSVGDTIKSFKRGMRDARDVGDDIKEEVREINGK